MYEMTHAQIVAVEKLERAGWRWTHQDDDTVYMSKRGAVRSQTFYCEVSADGTVDGHEDAKKVMR